MALGLAKEQRQRSYKEFLSEKTLLAQVMRIHVLLPHMESDLISTEFKRLVEPGSPDLSSVLLKPRR
jgi:hypothetical protein